MRKFEATEAMRKRLQAGLDLVFVRYHQNVDLAGELGVTKQAIHVWKKKGYIPMDRVKQVSRATGISPSKLRPDIF